MFIINKHHLIYNINIHINSKLWIYLKFKQQSAHRLLISRIALIFTCYSGWGPCWENLGGIRCSRATSSRAGFRCTLVQVMDLSCDQEVRASR